MEGRIIEIIRKDPSITIRKIATMLEISEKTVFRSLAKLKRLGLVVRHDSDKNGYWEVLA